MSSQQLSLVVPTIHTSHIRHLSITAGLPYMASTSEDAVKIWETHSGKLIRTIPSVKGKGFAAAAVSPNLKWLATAGNVYEIDMRPSVAPALQLWDPLTGAHIRQFHTFVLGERVVDLSFSPHQRYLMAVVYSGELSTLLFDPETGEKHLSLPGFGSFAESGEYIVLRQAESVMLADIAGGDTQLVLAEPCLLAHAAGGYVYLLTKTGRLVHWSMASQSIVGDHALPINPLTLDAMDKYTGRERAQFSQDGKRLIVYEPEGAITEDEWGEQAYRFRVFSTATGQLESTVPAGSRGGWGTHWGIYTPDLAYFLIAPIVQENVDNRSIVEAYSTSTGVSTHTFGIPAFEATTWANKYTVDLDLSAYDRGELIVVRGRAFLGAAAVFKVRTGQSISMEEEALDAFLKKYKSVKDERWRIVCDDFLSYQLIDTRTSAAVATLIFSESGTDAPGPTHTWAVTTPSGLFDASPDMMRYLHYVAGMEIIELDQLKERYYEPGLLSKLLGLNQDPLRSVEAFNAVPLYPEMAAKVSDDRLKLLVNLTPRSGGIGKLSLFVNGKEVAEDANPQRLQLLSIDLTEYAEYYLPGETNKLALRVYNEAGWLKSSALEVNHQPPATARGGAASNAPAPATATMSRPKPALYAIVIGTADYAGDKLDLQFADRDAACFSEALRATAPKLFGDKVSVILLSTDTKEKSRQDVSSKSNIQKAFSGIASKAKAQDILVIYLSGHGVNYGPAETGQFYYLTKDIASENLSDPEIRNNYAISSAELTEWIKAIPALKQVMVIDACNSGKVVEDLAVRKDLNSSQIRALDRMKDRTGMFILTGSAADKVSYEAGQYGQGLLTYSLLQGMSGLALTEDKRVDVMTLFQYSRDKVPELAKGVGGVQTPVLAFPVSGASFDIGIVDASVKIPLAQVKPVFIRNNFSDDDTFDDGLGLTQALADHFRRLTVKGAQAELIYVDVNVYENAYSIKGRYTVKGDMVEVRARLFKGKTTVGAEFKVAGKKSDVPALVEAIAGKVSGMVD